MTNDEALSEIKEAGGFFSGHFILKTGRHCPTFLQKTFIPGYEVARVLNAKLIFLEKENGKLCLRGGFHIPPRARVLLVEDVVYSGASSRESIQLLRGEKANIIGAACLIDRSGGTVNVGVNLVSLASLHIPDYSKNEVPPELAAISPIRPGSRGIIPTFDVHPDGIS